MRSRATGILKRSPPCESRYSPFPYSTGMDQYHLQGGSGEPRHKGKNVVWSLAMDKCLVEALTIQVRNGNKVDKCFNEKAYTAACVAVNTRFDLSLNNQKVINRLKTIKKRYRIIRDMLNQDRFTWNPNTKMVECSNEILWTTYIAAHPDARIFRGKKIEMYDELKIVCGNYQAPNGWGRMIGGGSMNGSRGTESKSNDEGSASFLSPSSEEDQSETDGTETESSTQEPEYNPPPTQMPAGGQHMPAGGQHMPAGSQPVPLGQPVRETLKRPRGSETLQDAMLAVASSIRQLADAVEQSNNKIDAPDLLQAVMELDGLEEAKQMYVFEYLNADPVKARAFMAYNARMRKIYLSRQFWWWKQ